MKVSLHVQFTTFQFPKCSLPPQAEFTTAAEHTILLRRERVNKGTKRMNSLRLSPHLISSILRDFTRKTTA